MKTIVSSKGQIVLPTGIREQDDINAGQQFEFERIERGMYRLVRRKAVRREGMIGWLLACPEKGYFVPINSESTNGVPSDPTAAGISAS
jgi:AbrB family looped-hinge helix DNA binding protein